MLPSTTPTHYSIAKTILCCSNCFWSFENQEVFLHGVAPSRFGTAKVNSATAVAVVEYNLPIVIAPRRERFIPVCVACAGSLDTTALPKPLPPPEPTRLSPLPPDAAPAVRRASRPTGQPSAKPDALAAFLSDL